MVGALDYESRAEGIAGRSGESSAVEFADDARVLNSISG
jgi:hypothetical protein